MSGITLKNIGVWERQYREYKYSTLMANELKGQRFICVEDGNEYEIELAESVYFPESDETKDLRGEIANEPNELSDEGQAKNTVYTQVINITAKETDLETGNEVEKTYSNEIAFTLHFDGKKVHAYLCESRGNYTGGIFKKATVLYNMSDNLFFGCENGVICSFNFDQRDEYGELPSSSYHFDERTIFSGCATLMDNCQIPHLTKSTIKRSTVIKTKTFMNSAAKVKVRTNKNLMHR